MDVSDAVGRRTPVEARLFHSLAGEWRLSRAIPGQGTMTGVARFREVEPGVLRYREQGRLRLSSGAALDVWRDYDYVLESGLIRVAFPSGETLHVLRVAAEPGGEWPLVATDVHLCGLDTYDGEYRFESESRITVRMRVRGPSKDYRISTVLERVGGGGQAP
jgi:hypothetical protein